MCGVAGFVLRGKQRDLTKALHDMTRSIAHRGPDDGGFFETVTKNSEHYIGLGYRRLSIIDLENGHQPLSNRAKTTYDIFNGEAYNFNGINYYLHQQLIRY